MSSKIKKEIFLCGAAMCIAFGYSTMTAGTYFASNFIDSKLTQTSNEDQVFFEAEKIYTVNFQGQSPRTASQATHDQFMTTWTNKISNSSERISRNLRGFDLLVKANNRANFNIAFIQNSYLTNTLIYSAHNFKTSNLTFSNPTIHFLSSNSNHINLCTTHSPHGASNLYC